MRKISKLFYAVCALVIASAAPVNAFNMNDPLNVSGGGAAGSMGGPYVAIQGAMNGSTLDGSGTNANGEKLNDASLGNVFGSVGINAGWSIPLGENFLVGLDLNFQPGEGKIKVDTGAGDKDSSEDIDVTMQDSKTITLMPMIAVSDTSALYIKGGYTHIDLVWGGDVIAGLNSSMKGNTLAVGSRTLVGESGFFQTEFGVNDFDTLNIHTNNSASAGTASPESVYGSFSIGIKF